MECQRGDEFWRGCSLGVLARVALWTEEVHDARAFVYRWGSALLTMGAPLGEPSSAPIPPDKPGYPPYPTMLLPKPPLPIDTRRVTSFDGTEITYRTTRA